MEDSIMDGRTSMALNKLKLAHTMRPHRGSDSLDGAPVHPVSARTLKSSQSLDQVTLFNNTLFGGGRTEQPLALDSEEIPVPAAPQQHSQIPAYLPSAFPRPSTLDSPRTLSGLGATSRPSSAASRVSSDGRALTMTLSQQMRLQRLTGDHLSPRQSLSPRGTMVGSPKSTALVGPLAERQTSNDVDRALLPRRSSGPDISILNAEAGLGSIIDTSDMRSFLMRPGPANMGPIRCIIKRERTSSKAFPKYTLFLEGSNSFLMAACPRKHLLGEMKVNSAANYTLSIDQQDLTRSSQSFFGKLRSNFLGTEFTLFDSGPNPKRTRDDEVARQELAAVTYQYNVMGTRGPRRMVAMIPALDVDSRPLTFRASARNEKAILTRYRKSEELYRLITMVNKPPKWNAQLGAYCLNFNGRVTHASVKNFQLVTEENPENIILQFGKVGQDIFTMDYRSPMSAMQAFGICLSSLDNKVACE